MTSVVKGAFTANKDGGNGNDTVQVTAPANDSGDMRTGTFIIRNTNGTKQITIICNQNVQTTQITNITYKLYWQLNQKNLSGRIECRDQNDNLANSPISITLYVIYTTSAGKIKYASPISIDTTHDTFAVSISNFLQDIDLENYVGEVLLAFNNVVGDDPVETYEDSGIDYETTNEIIE